MATRHTYSAHIDMQVKTPTCITLKINLKALFKKSVKSSILEQKTRGQTKHLHVTQD